MTEPRFYAVGRDVFDREKPDRYCGFLFADTAERMAADFNSVSGESDPQYFSWQYIADDEMIDTEFWDDELWDEFSYDDEDEEAVNV